MGTDVSPTNAVLPTGGDISINLYPGQIAGYARHGQALHITLANGEVLVIEQFFDGYGQPSGQLYVSAGGELMAVELVSGDDGAIYAGYEATGDFGKFNPDDEFFFLRGPDILISEASVEGAEDDGAVGMLLNPFVGIGALSPLALGSAAVGAGVLGNIMTRDGDDDDGESSSTSSGGDGDGDDDGDTDGKDGGDGSVSDGPMVEIGGGVQSSGDVVNASTAETGVVITGTGTPGGVIVVTIDDKTAEGVVGEDGTWEVIFEPGEVPGGEYEVPVSVVITDKDGRTDTDTDVVEIDTVTTVTFAEDSVEGDGNVNAAEASDGVVLTGTVEAGATVVVTVFGKDYTATVDGTTWTCGLPAADVPGGTYDMEVTVTATDSHGNTASTDGTVFVDTETHVTINAGAVGGDGTVNGAEHSAGTLVTGTAEAGASVVVSFGSVSHTVTATAQGTWSTTFSSAEISGGTYEATITAVATDALGNTASTSGTVDVDTETFVTVETDSVEGDGIVNYVERQDGITLTGTAEANATVEVSFGGTMRTVTADGSGDWSADFPRSSVATGEVNQTVTVTATDAAGNSASTSGSVQIDTLVDPLTGADPVTADDRLNAQEARSGVTLTGTVEAGSSVMVTFEGTTRAADVDASGNWSVDFTAAEVPAGEYTADISVAATDIAGNTRTITDSFAVDTVAPEVPLVTSLDRGLDGLRSIGISEADEGLAVTEIGADGSASQLGLDAEADPRYGEVDLHFDSAVPDGSQLVISSTDDAGNQNATIFVLDEAGTDTVDLGNDGFEGFDIGAIDLNFALDSELTLTAADLEGLSANDNRLTIHGGNDDTVTMTGATATGDTETIGSRTYDIYTLGDEGGTVIIDEDISVVI